jgi:hypothetical protein
VSVIVQAAMQLGVIVSAYIKTLLVAANAAAALTTLGVSSFMQSVLAATTRGTFLTTSTVGVLVGTINDDAVATVAIGTATAGSIIGWHYNLGNRGGFITARAAASANTCAVIATTAGITVGVTTGALTGTTFTDGQLNFSVDTSGNLYIENRTGGSLAAFTVYILKL